MEEVEKIECVPVPKSDDPSSSQGKSCALCGCSTPAVRCDRCNSQIFCLSCDDMYHRHPKRRLHLRKAVDSIWSSARSPRLRRHTDLPGDPSKIPIPPPRSKKRERHMIGGRIFLKSGFELGSFGHSKVFDLKDIAHAQKDFFAGQKSPADNKQINNENEMNIQNVRSENTPDAVYQNDSIINQEENMDTSNAVDRSPWNTPRPNISSPIQVSIPSSSPDLMANGQTVGYPTKPQSHSVADLTGASTHPVGIHPYHFPHPYPYMHPPLPPYSHSMAHLNCAQCFSSSWSNLASPHASPYFHPMPWGSAQSTLSRGQQMVGHSGQMKHSHGDLITYPDSNFHYPYHGGGFYPNGPPAVDPNFVKDLHQQAEMLKAKKSPAVSKGGNEEMEETSNPAPSTETSNPTRKTTDVSESDGQMPDTATTQQASQDVDEDIPKAPEKPTEPWACVHCTYVNPPGIHICEVCCRTSYGNNSSKVSEDQNEDQLAENRDTESPMELFNRDAIMSSPEISENKETQKVIVI